MRSSPPGLGTCRTFQRGLAAQNQHLDYVELTQFAAWSLPAHAVYHETFEGYYQSFLTDPDAAWADESDDRRWVEHVMGRFEAADGARRR